MKDLAQQLQQRSQQQLYRSRLVVETPQGVHTHIDGKDYLTFCSNDYLGLANHPDIVEAFHKGLDNFGAGSGAAHLITGHSRAHHALEEELAAFLQRPRVLLFSTGYMANLGVMSALLGRGDRVFADHTNHASLLDGARLSGARLLRYRHNDADDLETRLQNAAAGELLVATDGVFSMDGDVAPLPQLADTASAHGAWLMVDDAHGLGVTGPGGRGTVAQAGLDLEQVPILMGTLGKAFGTFGAFVAGSEELIETLIQEARTYIYTTAPPPALACATRVALRLVQQDDWRREQLQQLLKRFRQGAEQLGLALCDSHTPIQPLITGTAAEALRLSRALREQGILISAIRPPTVAEGQSRLRITFSAAHSEQQVDRLLAALEGVMVSGRASGCA
ncbi:MAG: 8-amino-7-oxononanoate synthase [Gammaproteobacteria bacterium]|nr:8-amino-7-oxononanoate synthase [Gammaproteobacteria bacterium]MDH3887541.1 8-amino-7-oxononanoate synthase [Gammaproteobacteria bacterium]MDH3935130.1 8-amino-7-oxononanoate synthase [Gammaproteobacteria bacterium]MDH3985644.1 8-amino-7-oxononanoate synthase [Gammaproteobacteria bacterium]